MSTPFQRWYEVNKEKLAAARKTRYRTDPEYREKVIERARQSRTERRGEDIPPGYAHHMVGAAEVLGITLWTLREWRKKNYFPEPYEFKGRRWFTAAQIRLLVSLRSFFEQHGVRTSGRNRGELEGLTSLIYSNWNL